MAITDIRAFAHLSDSDIEALGREFDAIRRDVEDSRGVRDARYIRNTIRLQRVLELGGRAVLFGSPRRPLWVLGAGMLSLAKIIENMELGHNVMHGQWDWMNDPEVHSTTWEWDMVCASPHWKHSHNYIHHKYTNVVGMDHDVGYKILRVTRDEPWEPRRLFQPFFNVLLAAICEELRIHSILTTEVINWAHSAVREFDLARKLVHHAIKHRQLPKHLDASLVMLRDPKLPNRGEEELVRLAQSLTDPNFRIFVEGDQIHVMNRAGYWKGIDAFELFDEFTKDTKIDPAHAFYLGYELAKAVTALTLGKEYNQDMALRWGFLTVEEQSAHERRRRS